jgi:hypothetical protein
MGETGEDVATYVQKSEDGRWGGGIEIAVVSRKRNCDIYLYEKDLESGGFRRVHCFTVTNPTTTMHLLYVDVVHYDTFIPRGKLVAVAKLGWSTVAYKSRDKRGRRHPLHSYHEQNFE